MEIDLNQSGSPALVAGDTLRKISDSRLFFVERGFRHPLGIYNVSISRIVERANNFSEELYRFFSRFNTLGEPGSENALKQLEERLEMFAYALAEHVDDCETLLKTFFKSDAEYAKAKPVRRFKDSIKSIRRRSSFLANAIKHNHQRVRFFESEFFFTNDKLVLLGFFLERFSNGAIGPDPNFLGPDKKVASCVGFLWSSLLGLIETSRILQETLLQLNGSDSIEPRAWNDFEFRKLIASVGRLPLYIFDDENPFQKASLKIIASENDSKPDGLTGSFYRPSKNSVPLGPGSFSIMYVGDGVTKSFDFALPSRAAFPDVLIENN